MYEKDGHWAGLVGSKRHISKDFAPALRPLYLSQGRVAPRPGALHAVVLPCAMRRRAIVWGCVRGHVRGDRALGGVLGALPGLVDSAPVARPLPVAHVRGRCPCAMTVAPWTMTKARFGA